VSIIPRGAAALGMTMQRPLEDRYLLTEPELSDRLAILLGGRSAEEIVFKQVSTGAQNDLERATDIARAMVIEYGMSEKIGPLSYGRDGFRGTEGRLLFPGEGPTMSQELAGLVDGEVKRLVNEAHATAQEILRGRRELLDSLSRVLMAAEVIEGSDLKAYAEGRKPIPEPEEVARDQASTDRLDTGPEIIASQSE